MKFSTLHFLRQKASIRQAGFVLSSGFALILNALILSVVLFAQGANTVASAQGPSQAIAPHSSLLPNQLFQWSSPIEKLKPSQAKVLSRTLPDIRDAMNQLEMRLYQRQYLSESLTQRIKRIEKTVFGQKQSGYLDERLVAAENHLGQSERHVNTQQTVSPLMLAYLEKRLFNTASPRLSSAQRLQRLEQHILGRTFVHDDDERRLNRITYAVPLLATDIRMSNNAGQPVASTENRLPLAAEIEPVEFKAPVAAQQGPDDQQFQMVSVASSLSSNSSNQIFKKDQHNHQSSVNQPSSNAQSLAKAYSELLHKDRQQQWLRWQHLPVKVFQQPPVMPAQQRALATAVTQWQQQVPIQFVSDSALADIVVQWRSAPLPSQSGQQLSVTRPILHLDASHRIRSVVLIDMAAYDGFFKSQPLLNPNHNHLLHGLSHQLGHALGLWGHSSDATDVMYPLFALEATDIPKKLNSKHHLWQQQNRPKVQTLAVVTQPTASDLKTLQAVYNGEKSQDLSMLSPF